MSSEGEVPNWSTATLFWATSWIHMRLCWRSLHSPTRCVCPVRVDVSSVNLNHVSCVWTLVFMSTSSPVKLAIWEVSLDNFVESIQSIPEVTRTLLKSFNLTILTNFFFFFFSSSDPQVGQKSEAVVCRSYAEDRRAFHTEVSSVFSHQNQREPSNYCWRFLCIVF